MSNNNKWGALSMQDRALLIREAVRHGITDINSIRDTWEHRFDGESSQPTEDEYIAQRAKESIYAALDKAYNRTETVIPVFGEKTEADKIKQAEELEKAKGLYNMYKTFKQKIDRGELIGVDFGFGYLDKKQINKVLSEAEAKLMHATYMHDADKLIGPGCVATSMDNYGKGCISNQQFAENPEKYGFVKIGNKEIKPGDIVQFDRKHMLMSNTQSTNNQGELTNPLNMRYSGSNGYDAVRKGSRYPADWKDIEAYRFVGDKADSLQWKKEYREKYGHQFSGEEDPDSNTITTPFFSSVLDSASSKYLQDITSPKVPYKHSTEEPSHYQRDILHQNIAGISDVTQKVKFGDGDLYLYNGKTNDKDPHSVFVKAKNYPFFYKVQKAYLDTVPMEHFDIISQKDLRKYMPKRDYIGSNAKSTTAQNEEVREKVAKLIPGFTDSLSVIANRHNINPSLMYRRISKEGYLDHEARLYNEVIPSIQQKNFFDDVADQEVSGFNEFGLDDIRDVLESNQLKLTKPVQWRPDENVRYNEKGRRVYSVYFPTLWDAMEVKAAELARRKEIMKERGYSGRDLDIWTNASYNLGTEHEDLNNTEWIRKTYSFPDYSHLFKK